ncbi:MAG: DnaJ domain-containing protein [Lacibacter sp.]|jgi:curved DNA-binding protein CbpA
MFVDYYAILEIDETASLEEIKLAFRQQAIKWHPDRNPNKDTTRIMQLINEAYLILKDTDARNRYDREYQFFKGFKTTTAPKEEHREKQQEEAKQRKPAEETKKPQPEPEPEPKFEYAEYSTKDDVLKRWMDNAKRQAVELAKQTIKDFAGMVAVGAKEGAKAAGQMLVFQIAIGLLFLLIFGLSKSCHS